MIDFVLNNFMIATGNPNRVPCCYHKNHAVLAETKLERTFNEIYFFRFPVAGLSISVPSCVNREP